MSVKRFIIAGFSSLMLCVAIPAHSEWEGFKHELPGDAKQGQEKAGVCAACHGVDGNSVNPIWPSLAGQNRRYTFNQLRDYKQGKDSGRYNPNMSPMVASLSEADMWDIAAYYENMKPKLLKVDPKHIELGQLIYRGGNIKTGVVACIACHGPKGEGNSAAGFARLSGQQVEYTIKQLRDYKNGVRKNGPNNIMQTIAGRMSDKEIIAVANYVSGLN